MDAPADTHFESVNQSHAASYDAVQPVFQKSINTVVSERRALQEKLATRSKLIEQLKEHQERNTFPIYIPAIRCPQLPAVAKSTFDPKFEDIMLRMRKEVLKEVINARVNDEQSLEQEISTCDAKIQTLIHTVGNQLVSQNLCPAVTASSHVETFKSELRQKEITATQKKKLGSIGRAILEQQKKEQPEPIQLDSEPTEMDKMKTAVTELRKELQTVKKSAIQQQKSPQPQKAAQPKGKKPDKKKKVATKPSSKDTQGNDSGAAGRGGKHNHPGRGNGKRGPAATHDK